MTNPARILFITQEYSAVSAGGVGVYAYELAKALSEAGAIVHVLAPGSSTRDELISPQLTIHWVKTVNRPLIHIPSFHLQVWRHARRIIRQHQLTTIHCNENAGITAIGYRPTVATIHHPIAAELSHNTFLQRLINYPDVMMEHVVVRFAPIITVPSHTVLQLFRERYSYAAQKVRVILNGIDLTRYRTDQISDVLKQYQLPAGRPVIFFPGGARAKRKGALAVVEALAAAQFKHNPIILVTGTSRETGWENELKNAVRAKHLDDWFVWGGEVDYDQLPGYFHSTHFTIYPSTFEGFGLPVLEALACGRPVIATATGEAAYIVDDTNGVLIPPTNNTPELTAALELFINQPKERERRGAAARSGMAETVDWSAIAAQYLQTHRKVLSS